MRKWIKCSEIVPTVQRGKLAWSRFRLGGASPNPLVEVRLYDKSCHFSSIQGQRSGTGRIWYTGQRFIIYQAVTIHLKKFILKSSLQREIFDDLSCKLQKQNRFSMICCITYCHNHFNRP